MLMNKIKTSVSLLELKQLLQALADGKASNVCIRVRVIGEMWQKNHMRVIKIDSEKLTLLDESLNRLNFVQKINSIMQFEIDSAFQEYQPNFHYDVTL